ncbi:MAG: hypothetical protein IK105_01970 [Thermoguttaceae bacterium]|nr:hypothetical protein [Thermoguttaceae bacterium]
MKNLLSSRRLRLESLEERTLLAVTAGLAETAALAAPTGATNWVVNTADDPSSWSDTDGEVSLREAIGRAQTGDTITFDESLSGDTVTLNGNQFEVNKAITIDATSIGGITIDADGQSRVFYISGGTADTPVNLVALTITGGYASEIWSGTWVGGGGICNEGVLALTDCTVTGNSVN